MALDVGLITALLIEYDCEHPKTLGEMADRRAIYAQRLADMSVENVMPQTVVAVIGDGVSSEYKVDHPFGRASILVNTYDTETGEYIQSSGMVGFPGHIAIGYSHPIKHNGARVVITS